MTGVESPGAESVHVGGDVMHRTLSLGLRLTVIVALGILAAPLGAGAQPVAKVPRVGYVGAASPTTGREIAQAFVQGLRELGYVEGQNIAIEYRWAEGKLERLPNLVADVIHRKVDVIVSSSSPAIQTAMQQTSAIPIIMSGITDPVGAGFVANLARPGGNVTGVSMLATELSGKRLELLKETLPNLARVAVVWNPTHPGQAIALKNTQLAAQALGVTLTSREVRTREDFESVFGAIAKERAEALSVLPDPLIFSHRHEIAALAAKHRLPAMYGFRAWVDAGGLMSYGPNVLELSRRAAIYVDKILKGAKPTDLPVEQPTKLELVISLKTAKALSLTIPPSLLLRADHVIE